MESKIKSSKSRAQRKNKLKEDENKADPVTQLQKFCQLHNCDDPKYISEHRRLTLVLSGTHIFSKIPEFRPTKKFRTHAEGKLDVAKQALLWIKNNPSPSLYWKKPKTAELVTDIIAELAEGVYENGTDKKHIMSFMEYLEIKAQDKLRDRLEKKGVPQTNCGTPQYTRALEVCRLSQVMCTAASVFPEIICAPSVVFREMPRPTISKIKPALAQEKTSLTTAKNTMNPTSRLEKLPPLTDLEKFYGSVGVLGNIAMVKDLDDKLRLLTAIISQDNIRFVDRLQVLSNRNGKRRLDFLQYLLDFFSEDLIKDISGAFVQGERSWTEKNITQFSQVQSKDLLGDFDAVASSLGHESKKHLELFLSWHQNGMFKTITDLSNRVGAKTQHYLEKMLELEGAGLFTLMDEATAISEGEPARLLSSYICRQTDEVSQKLHKIEEKDAGRTSQILSDALRYHQLNIFREINALIGESSEGQNTRNHFILLADCKANGALGHLATIDYVAGSFGTAEFLEISLKLFHYGLHRWVSNYAHIIGNDNMFFQKVFLLAGALTDGTASQAVKDAAATIQQLVPPEILTNNGTTPISQVEQAPTSDSTPAPDLTPAPITPASDERHQLPSATTNPGLKPISQFSLPGSKFSAPPKQNSTSKWQTSSTGSKSTAPSSKASSSSAKDKKADKTLPKPTESAKRPMFSYKKCLNCPRRGYQLTPDGPLICEACKSEYNN